ncbi:hypothetical protein CU098_011784, partial [Rhizopus stolonifer]
MNSASYYDHDANTKRIQANLCDSKAFASEDKHKKSDQYHHQERTFHLHKWSANYTSKLQHMACTTTQRTK